MATCPLTKECAYYSGKLTAPSDAVADAKKRFCNDNYEACARYKVVEAAGAESVPADLMPDMVSRAEVLISEGETIRFRVDRKNGKGGKVKRS